MGAGLLIIAVLAVILLGSYFAYRYTFYFVDHRLEDECLEIPTGEQYQKHGAYMQELITEMRNLPYEQVYTTSVDGKKLAGRYYAADKDAPFQILMHGYKSNGIRDFCGGHRISREAGYNTIVVDQRSHGKSEGHALTFGVMERYDCLSWVQYVCERFGGDTPIILTGLSMGAATVLMASGLELPANVKGIIADCPYSSPKAIICKVGEYMKLPVKLIYPFVYLGALLFGHFRLSESSPVEAVKYAKVPILLIHGEDDRFVPCEMSREICSACASEITLETFPEAGHGISYLLDPERYAKVTKIFMERCLGD